MIQQFARPHPHLRHLIDRYWCWQSATAEPLPALLPGTAAELWFHLAEPPQCADGTLPREHLVASRAQRLSLQSGQRSHLVAVRFRNAGLYSLFAVPLEQLVDRLVPLNALDLTHRIPPPELSALDWPQQVQQLDRWLLNLLAQAELDPFAALVEQHYYLQNGSHGYSSKRFQRLFRRYTGISARRFMRLRRFQLITRQLLLQQRADYLDTALVGGYYDQAHFIRDFRELAGETPGRFLIPGNFRQHFYQHSLV